MTEPHDVVLEHQARRGSWPCCIRDVDVVKSAGVSTMLVPKMDNISEESVKLSSLASSTATGCHGCSVPMETIHDDEVDKTDSMCRDAVAQDDDEQMAENFDEETLPKKRQCVEKYQRQFSWLRDTNFLHDLENDSVDSEIIEEELSALQEEEKPTRRKKIVKLLQSNPVQILLFVLVLLDAGIVVAQIILDINSIKGKLHNREDQISRLLTHIALKHRNMHCGDSHADIDAILEQFDNRQMCEFPLPDRSLSLPKQRRDLGEGRQLRSAHTILLSTKSNISSTGLSAPQRPTNLHNTSQAMSRISSNENHHYGQNSKDNEHVTKLRPLLRISRGNHRKSRTGKRRVVRGSVTAPKPPCDRWDRRVAERSAMNLSETEYDAVDPIICKELRKNTTYCYKKNLFAKEHDPLHDIAHGLHFGSIAILAFLFVEDLVKIVAMGKDFLKHKVEVVDGVLIVASLVMDMIFLGGVSGEEGQKAVAVLIVLLLWRIARVTDGIVITVKQRQEFRIRLQKRARRNAERRIDTLEEERHSRTKQIQALKELCLKAGLREEEIEACAPRRGPRRVSTTMCALSSVARLSVSMTMSMSSGLFSLLDEENTTKGLDRNFNTQKDCITMQDSSLYSPKNTRRKSEGNIIISPKSLRKKFAFQSPVGLPGLQTQDAQKKPRPSSPTQEVKKTPLEARKSLPDFKPVDGKVERDSQSPRHKKRKREEGMSQRLKAKLRKEKKEADVVTFTASPLSSPVNSSGVKIVIHEGSESESSVAAADDDAGSVGSAEMTLCFKAASTVTAEKSVTDMSQVLLLNEIN